MDKIATQSPRQKRDPEETRKRILKAAKKEFAQLGLAGARVDTIADRAKANKRMIYHYFGNKEDLFQAVIEEAYLDIRAAERKLKLELLEPVEAIKALVRFSWDYYLKNPEFLALVNSENLHRARHLKKAQTIIEVHGRFIGMVEEILQRGVGQGVFRPDVDPVQLVITIAGISYYYQTNRYTGSIIFQRDLMSDEAREERLNFNIDTILRLLRP
ncbi:TetR family transcriptional regulator [Marinobacterium nitratireducens]|uniref:TetR family transcriptional regulator n=1 Tax=Marinobacterium nitratireducens TaxID=518897 RepID=A0A917ZL89_9GAMM|nr:TetR/AcrR family transcriptional regulator [Marinobacterium nitratireducens]GGO83923.1 TetR family transcriptional regulator [Marinobacterium nitratireducens]